ncbi:uncharacterized protein LOC111816212 [Octodon degus]|uniref:Uncharacterized protein LOC111816212 n=1 Tax=Octodon degus TaxID=10160 RepID=A0A6P6E9E6_OCTDE|nr:uncharacterized protein LOC111816212 [Octodon degus]
MLLPDSPYAERPQSAPPGLCTAPASRRRVGARPCLSPRLRPSTALPSSAAGPTPAPLAAPDPVAASLGTGDATCFTSAPPRLSPTIRRAQISVHRARRARTQDSQLSGSRDCKSLGFCVAAGVDPTFCTGKELKIKFAPKSPGGCTLQPWRAFPPGTEDAARRGASEESGSQALDTRLALFSWVSLNCPVWAQTCDPSASAS